MRDYSVSWSQRTPPTQNRRRNPKGFILFGIFCIVLVYILVSTFFHKPAEQETLSQQSPSLSDIFPETTGQQTPEVASAQTSGDIISTLEATIEGGGGTYSIYVYDLNAKKGFGVDEDVIFTAASVNKVPILASLYHLAGKDEIDLEKTVTLQKQDVQDYGTGSMRYDKLGTVYSIKTMARLMMEKSDNTAAYILGTHIVTHEKIQALIEEWGLTQTDMENNKTSASDMALLMEKMYKGEITNIQLTKEMLTFMDRTDFDDRIPAGLPADTKFYHKTGDEIGRTHDVGIIDLPGRPYFLGVLTMDMTDEGATKRKIAEISRIVYEYMRQ